MYVYTHGNVKYYFNDASNLQHALSVFYDSGKQHTVRLLQYADVVIDEDNNKILKCRYTLAQVFDNFDLDAKFKAAKASFEINRLKAMIVSIKESLNDGRVVENVVMDAFNKVMIPAETELAQKYVSKIPAFRKAQEELDCDTEDALIDELDKLWDMMSHPEKEYCEIMSAKYFIENQTSDDK